MLKLKVNISIIKMRPGEANRSFVPERSVGRTVGQCKLQERRRILYDDNRLPGDG